MCSPDYSNASYMADLMPPENEKGYPEHVMFGMMPSYGFYCRHVKDIQFNNIYVGFERDDTWPALVCDNVKGLELNEFRCEISDNNEKPVIFQNTENISIYRSPELQIPKN